MRSIKELRAAKAANDAKSPSGMRWFALALPIVIATIAALVFVPKMLAGRREQQLREQGKPAVAEIVEIRETGNLYNRKPEVELELRVRPPDAAEFTLELTKVLEHAELAKYVVGSLVDVRYDPAQPDDVAIMGLASAEPPK
jgi:uncharacterized SAM-binding protein YcdF (DUF218 family)